MLIPLIGNVIHPAEQVRDPRRRGKDRRTSGRDGRAIEQLLSKAKDQFGQLLKCLLKNRLKVKGEIVTDGLRRTGRRARAATREKG